MSYNSLLLQTSTELSPVILKELIPTTTSGDEVLKVIDHLLTTFSQSGAQDYILVLVKDPDLFIKIDKQNLTVSFFFCERSHPFKQCISSHDKRFSYI
jgi:hypothetical protein